MPSTDANVNFKANDKASATVRRLQGQMENFSNAVSGSWINIRAKALDTFHGLQRGFELVKEGARFEQTQQAFAQLSASMGASSDEIIEDLRAMSAETLSTSELMAGASRAMALGIGPENLGKMMEISRAAARAMGQDVGKMFSDIALGVGRQSRMILDNLGIIVKSEDAYKNLAASLGKTVEQLTDAERKTAFMNEVLRGGGEMVDRMGIKSLNAAERLQAFTAKWENFRKEVALATSKLFTFALQLNNTDGIIDNVFSSLTWITKQISTQIAALNLSIIGWQTLYQLWSNMGSGQFDNIFDATNDALEKAQRKIDELAGHYVEFQETIGKTKNRVSRAMDEIVVDTEEATTKIKFGFKDLTESIQSSTDQIYTSFTNTFGESIFQTMKGNLEGAGNAWERFGNTVLRILSDIIAKKIIAASINMSSDGSGFGGFGTGFGDTVGWFTGGPSFSSGGTDFYGTSGGGTMSLPSNAVGTSYVPKSGLAYLHKGEEVVPANRARGGGPGGGSRSNTTIVIQAWDTSDIMRNMSQIQAAIAQGFNRNAPIRKALSNG